MVLRFLRDEQGATAIEYAMIASLVAMAMLGAVMTVGDRTFALYEDVAQRVRDAMS